MKLTLAVAFALVAVAVALPVEKVPEIVESVFETNPEGSYIFGFKSDDGTERQEEGVLKEVLNEENKPQNVVVVRGTFAYINKDGSPETINYFADESGYHADGKSVPKLTVAAPSDV